MNTTKEFTIDDARHTLLVLGELCSLAGQSVKANRCGCLDEIDPDLFESMACLTNKSLEFYEQHWQEMWQELRAFREQRDRAAGQAAPVATPKRTTAKGR
ncbi:MAG: hypothetical protein NTV05_05195 [Acidobacteria bacterium]|nr:hypothetical protein [Acidobacteriota bacterium]